MFVDGLCDVVLRSWWVNVLLCLLLSYSLGVYVLVGRLLSVLVV